MSVPAQGPPPASVRITTLLSPPANGLSGGVSLCALQHDRDWILQNEGAAQRILGGDAALDGVFCPWRWMALPLLVPVIVYCPSEPV